MQLFGTKAQKFIHCPKPKGTTGQAQNFATGRDWPGRAGTTSQNLGWDRVLMFCHGKGRDGIYSACPIPSRKIPGQPWGKREKIVIKSKFLKKKGRIFFAFFCRLKILGLFWTSQDRGVCPGMFAAALVPTQKDSGTRSLFLSLEKGRLDKETYLSWDNGTMGCPVPDCPGTSCPMETLLEIT